MPKRFKVGYQVLLRSTQEKKFKRGDIVVPRPCEVAWRTIYPFYVESMDTYAGQIGQIGRTETNLAPEIVTVVFPRPWECWQYRKEWLRKATEEEKRIYKFMKAVRGNI